MNSTAVRINVGDTFADRYLIEAFLGRGGMGEVFRVRDTLLRGQILALKILHADLNEPRHTERFLREVQLTRSVNHPHVVRTFDFGAVGSSLYFTMELCEGRSLRDRMRSGALGLHEALTLLDQTARGMQAIHEAGIVHRDLKPENIILTAENRAKIADFGVASPGTSSITESAELIGSAAYLAPEVWRSQEATTASDIYSFGVMLYEMLAGCLPFQGTTAVQMMYFHLAEEPADLGKFLSKHPKAVGDLVAAMLAKSPQDRPPSMAFIAEELEAAAGGGPASKALSRSGALLRSSRRRSILRSIRSVTRSSQAMAGVFGLLAAVGAAAIFTPSAEPSQVSAYESNSPHVPFIPMPTKHLVAAFDVTSLKQRTLNAGWKDSVRPNRIAAASSVESTPSFAPWALNGLPAVRFDGERQYLSVDAVAKGFQNARGFTALTVASSSHNGKMQTLWAFHESDREVNVLRAGFDEAHHLMIRTLRHDLDTIHRVGEIEGGAPAVYTIVIDGRQLQAFRNGSKVLDEPIAANLDFSRAATFSIGQEWDYELPSDFLKGDVAAVYLYNQPLDTEQRGQAERLLMQRFKIEAGGPQAPAPISEPNAAPKLPRERLRAWVEKHRRG